MLRDIKCLLKKEMLKAIELGKDYNTFDTENNLENIIAFKAENITEKKLKNLWNKIEKEYNKPKYEAKIEYLVNLQTEKTRIGTIILTEEEKENLTNEMTGNCIGIQEFRFKNSKHSIGGDLIQSVLEVKKLGV